METTGVFMLSSRDASNDIYRESVGLLNIAETMERSSTTDFSLDQFVNVLLALVMATGWHSYTMQQQTMYPGQSDLAGPSGLAIAQSYRCRW